MEQTTVRIITRADDCGSSRSHNRAIEECCTRGIVRNVSFMANASAIHDAAELLAERTDICFGLHATLNAEWERVRWGPVLPAAEVPSLVDESGYFLQSPALFLERRPVMEQIMAELQAQLLKLRGLGFNIRYVDSHMMFEWAIEGMAAIFDEWCLKEGLISHRPFYNMLPAPDGDEQENPVDRIVSRLKAALPGQYLMIGHPGYDDEETRSWGNAEYSGAQVAIDRHWERLMYLDPKVLECIENYRIEPIRYDEAHAT